ncbi:hypothetical protein F5887DRAFT_1061256 [Amanita rubescens]|nr:hypothetical protein F5887DRAFT_1061256 [Amanita rubescens]
MGSAGKSTYRIHVLLVMLSAIRIDKTSNDKDDGFTASKNRSATESHAASSATSYTPDPHAVSKAEAQFYYAGLHSKPTLLYRTGKEKWSPPEAQRHLKELCEVFMHPIAKVWNDNLGWKVVEIMDAHTIRFTTIDVVRFKKVEVYEAPEDEEDPKGEEEGKAKKSIVGPVTIWIGIFPKSTSATAAHDAAQDVLALLKDYQITDVDIDFRESFYTCEVGPQLLAPVSSEDPLVDVVSPLTPALGLRISTKARPDSQGTMALYLAEGSGSNRLLGLSCRHVLIGHKELGNVDYVRHPSAPRKIVLLLGRSNFTDIVELIDHRIKQYKLKVKRWRIQISVLKENEKVTNAVDAENAKAARIDLQGSLDEVEKEMKALGVLLGQLQKDWKKLDNRTLGHILHSPAIALGIGEHRFTEDRGIFYVNRAKLGDGFQGNKMDLGTKLNDEEFTAKCYPHGSGNWKFKYPKGRLLPLIGTITDALMRKPDMWDSDGELCLLVIKSGNSTGTTIGRATGIFSIVRKYKYFNNKLIDQTSMEWTILNYGSKLEAFSWLGDSGSIIADIRGRIGGMLTGGSGMGERSDITYATPFWWLLERINS